MKQLIFILINFFYWINCIVSPEEDNVIVLKDDTFEPAVKNYEILMVLFYSPWCEHSKKLLPEFGKAAIILKKQGIHLAKVDCISQVKLSELYQIQAFPTVKVFYRRKIIPYTGRRYSVDIVNWALKLFVNPIQVLNTEEEIKQYIEKNGVALIYFGNDKKDIEIIGNTSKLIEEYPFASVKSEKIRAEYKAKEKSIVLFKKTDEKRQDFSFINQQDVYNFVYKYAFRKVMFFDDSVSEILFEKNQPAVILFDDKKKESWEKNLNIIKKTADESEYKIKFVVSNMNDSYSKNLGEYIGVQKDQIPALLIVDNRKGQKKYKLDGAITQKNIINFIKNWEKNELKLFFKSEPEPKNNNGNVLILTANSYYKEVISNDNDVMVVFYAPWCGHCKALLPTYKELANNLTKQNKKLIFAEIDGTENEVDSVELTGFPTILFYPGNKKTEKPIEYEGDRTMNDMIKFLNEHSSNKIIIEKEKGKVKVTPQSTTKKEEKQKGHEKKEKTKNEGKLDKKQKEEKIKKEAPKKEGQKINKITDL